MATIIKSTYISSIYTVGIWIRYIKLKALIKSDILIDLGINDCYFLLYIEIIFASTKRISY